jgi:hypothetical protein
MANETPKPVTPASNPAPAPQQNPGEAKPNTDKPAGEQK